MLNDLMHCFAAAPAGLAVDRTGRGLQTVHSAIPIKNDNRAAGLYSQYEEGIRENCK
mgnify:CR=1 FL=1